MTQNLEKYVENNLAFTVNEKDSPIDVNFILEINRIESNINFFISLVASSYLVQKSPNIIAFNVVGPENSYNSQTNFKDQMKMIDFVWNQTNKPNITLHAGELTLQVSPLEYMLDRIRASIDTGHALKIGHALSIQ